MDLSCGSYGLTPAEIVLIELSVHPFKLRCTPRLEKDLAVLIIDESGLPAVAAVHEKADFPVARRDPERHSRSMKTNLKPANSKARALLKKLLASIPTDRPDLTFSALLSRSRTVFAVDSPELR